MGILKSILANYVPVNWVTGEVITADKLNRSEQGIVDLEKDLTELNSDLANFKNNTVKVSQGALTIAEGTFNQSGEWCYTPYFIPDDYVITTKRPLRMYLLAYSRSDHTFIGGWNGSSWSKTYTSNGFLFSIDFSEWTKQYPNYVFKLDFYDYSESLTPSDVSDSIYIVYESSRCIKWLDEWEAGSFEGNEPVSYNNRLRYMKLLNVEPGSSFSCAGTDIRFMIIFVNDVGSHTGSTSWESNWTITEPCNIKLLLKKADDSAISLADVAKLSVKIYEPKFEPVKVRVVPQYSIGDCMILRSGLCTILIDTGRPQDYQRLKNALSCEGVAKIDYLIVTHYHGDHISTDNVNSLISDYDMTDCTVILPPPIPETYSNPDETEVYPRQEAILAILESNNIRYINDYDYETRYMMLSGIRFKFYNLDQDSWYSENADYNQMSIVCIAEIGKNKVLFTGDMGQPLETKLITEIDDSVNIAKFGHHGLNETINIDFWHKIKPEVFFSCSPEVWHDELYLASHQIRFANYNNIKNIMTNTSGTIYINISEDGYDISGYNFMLSNLSDSEFFDYVL